MSEITTGVDITPRLNGFATSNVAPSPADNPQHDAAISAARCAVADYLRDVGLRDPELVARESKRIVSRTMERFTPEHEVTEESLSAAAIKLTVKRLESLLAALAAEPDSATEPAPAGRVVGARLPALLGRYAHALKQNRSPSEAVNELRGDGVSVVPQPKHKPMRQQSLTLIPAMLRRLRREAPNNNQVAPLAPATLESEVPTRFAITPRKILAILTLLTTVAATWLFCRILAADGVGLIDFPLGILYAVLFVWVAFSFWTATLGLIAILRRPKGVTSIHPLVEGQLPATAILMPVYNEDPTKVFANLRAIAQSLQRTDHAGAFHLFVLSDTTQPDVWLEEERAWAKMVAELPEQIHVFYRHRPKNTSRKAGNIADFCSRWGEHYKYMIVLDADSVMAGDTLVEMVRRMEADERIGILQAPPTPVNRQSFFARMQQFAAKMYGPVFLEGFAIWSKCDGNYWGHNAIIRVQPFMEHCDLPVLPGDGPLGGEILSHDFVEAALMRRAGWKVCLAHDLEGSYEECPTTMLDFTQRDQRWCQGNMQHVRLLLAEGLHPASRLHLGMGAMSYLASPLWLAFLVLTLAGAFFGGKLFVSGEQSLSGMWLFVLTMAMLLVPKLFGVVATVHQRRHADVPWHRVALSLLIETAASMLIAPIMMLLHSRFVMSTLMGTKVKWNAQQRDDRGVSLANAIAVHYPHTLIGLAVGTLVGMFIPGLLPWLSPVLLGLVLSIPLAMLLGSVKVGRALAEARLLMIPEEVALPEVLQAQREALIKGEAYAAATADDPEAFVAVLRDPAFYALHLGILRATTSEVSLSAELMQNAIEQWRTAGPRSLTTDMRRAVLGDSQALETLHILSRTQASARSSTLTT